MRELKSSFGEGGIMNAPVCIFRCDLDAILDGTEKRYDGDKYISADFKIKSTVEVFVISSHSLT